MYPAYYKYSQAYCVTIGSASIYNEMKYCDKLKPKNIPNMAMNVYFGFLELCCGLQIGCQGGLIIL